MYHKQSYPEEEVDVTVLQHREQKRIHHLTARVEHEEYGDIKIAYGFPKGQGWHEKLDGTEKYLLKLKDLALDEITPSNQEFEKEKSDMKDKQFKSKTV